MKQTIFVVSKGPHDYTRAEEHGTLYYMFPDKVNVFASDQLLKDIHEKLRGSSSDDFLIMSGNMLASAMAFSVLMAKHGVVNVLIYSFKHVEYEVRTIRRGQFQESAALEAK